MKAPLQHQAPRPASFTPVSRALVQRCSCGQHAGPGGSCTACKRKKGLHAAPGGGGKAAPARGVRVELQPHTARPEQFRQMSAIYAKGQTAVLDHSGSVRALDLAPAAPRETGAQLDTIRRRFGAKGLGQTLHGLAATRGSHFVRSALGAAGAATRQAQMANVSSASEEELFARPDASPGRLDASVTDLLARPEGGQPLPESLRARLAAHTGDALGDVRLYNTPQAHRAADAVGAQAFAVGRSVYFGAGAYQPGSTQGQQLLAHEVAHTVQQRGAAMPSFGALQVGRPADAHERQADAFAQSVVRGDAAPALAPAPALQVARVQRAISFARSNDAIATNTMGVGEGAAGFQIRPNATPLFDWWADVQINGNAGDPCGSWQVGPHQVVRVYGQTIHWGSGANRATRRCSLSALPIRDATAAGNTWYHDAFAQSFGACGDTRNTGLRDSPQTALIPWASPVAGKGGPTGSFYYGVGFVAYISARDTAAGTFRDLANMYWNTSIQGTFDTAQPVGSRVTATGGAVNRSRAMDGGSGEFPAMHGGAIANASHSCTDS